MRTIIRILPIGLAHVAAAAQDTTRAPGPSANLHVTSASGAAIDGTLFGNAASLSTTSSTGWGLTFGYGFNRWLAAYATIDDGGSQTTTTSGGVQFNGGGSQTLYQVDAGVRLGYPFAKGRVLPYGLLSYSRRMLRGEVGTMLWGNGTYSEWGSATTYGLGLQLYAARKVALDVSWQQSSGTYGHLEVPYYGEHPMSPSSTSSSRVLAGVTWQIGPVGNSAAPPAPSSDTMSVGENVRLHVGTAEVIGTIIALHRDTVFLQRVRKDTATQVGVPRECIGAVERDVPTGAVKAGVTNGAFLGAIGGALIGAAMSSGQAKAPQTSGAFLGTYVLGGAIVGGALGAVFSHEHGRWQPLHFEASPSATVEAREAVCRPWFKAP